MDGSANFLLAIQCIRNEKEHPTKGTTLLCNSRSLPMYGKWRITTETSVIIICSGALLKY